METKIIVWLVKTLYQLVVFILKLIGKGLDKLLELEKARRARSRTSPTAETPATIASASPSTTRPAAAPASNPLRQRLADELPKLAQLADGLVARCRREPACALLLTTFDDFVVPGLARIATDAPRARDRAAVIALLVEAARIANLLGLLEVLVQQRGDGDLVELIDDADALAAACYLPVADFCQKRGLPLSSDRVATLFGGDCSPALARVDDPTGMAILQLPWSWLAEVHRWPAVAHEVGHDFYMSVTGLDDELLARVGLTAVRDGGPMPTGANGFHRGHLDTLIAAWRHELVADAFGVMMLGPAYAITTLEIFANPADRDRTLVIDRDGDGYEAHPPAHVRAVFVCRLLQRMGYGKVGDVLEQQWRTLHGNPDRLYLPVANGWLHLLGDMLIEPALAVGVALYEEGFAALEQIPLRSMPGFDFGPREHEAAERVKESMLAGGRAEVAEVKDARLLIAGAVLAWSEQRDAGEVILRAARLAVGTLDLAVRRARPRAAPRDDSFTAELVRESIVLDVLLAPPRGSLLRR